MDELADDATGLRLLIVEDDELVREMVVRAAAAMGATVDAVSGGEEAMSRLRVERYDIVVTDLMMPNTSGLEVLKAARRCEHPVGLVVVTGYAERSDERAIAELGAILVQKPFRAADLVTALSWAQNQRDSGR